MERDTPKKEERRIKVVFLGREGYEETSWRKLKPKEEIRT